jgi:DNA-directed RNA polymerase sigma subunit (sigma70/sigma32)
LRGRKRAIVTRHFGLAGSPETLTEIADDLHLSPERTRALKNEALRELAIELDHAIGA